MNYTPDRKLVERRSAQIFREAGPDRVWLGIGAWRIDAHETVSRIRWAREQGAEGVVLFSQDSLRRRAGSFRIIRDGAFGSGARR